MKNFEFFHRPPFFFWKSKKKQKKLTFSLSISSPCQKKLSLSLSKKINKNKQVIQNRAESADGSARTLLLSVEDAVSFLDAGRRQSVRSRQAARRWLDDYRAPGQQVAVRVPKNSDSSKEEGGEREGGDDNDENNFRELSRLFPLSSSPYEARRESSRLDASIVEILVDRARGGPDDELLGSLAPGALLQVSQVLGSGFAPLFSLGLGGGGGGSGSSGGGNNNDDEGYSLNAKARDRRRERTGGGRSSDVAAAAAAAGGGGGMELGAELAEALEEVDERVYGAKADAAVGLLAAHKLSISPQGQQSRLDPKAQQDGPHGTTTYGCEFDGLAKIVGGGPWAMGMLP